MAPIPTFHGACGVYRPLTLEDADALFAAHGDPEVHLYWSGPAHTDIAETRDNLQQTLALSPWHWAITRDGGEALGRISLFTTRPGVGEIGVILRRAAQGQGLAGDALGLLTAYAFTDLRLHRLFADIDPANAASLHLFMRAGFVREGVLRDNWRTHLGLRDSVILARFPD